MAKSIPMSEWITQRPFDSADYLDGLEPGYEGRDPPPSPKKPLPPDRLIGGALATEPTVDPAAVAETLSKQLVVNVHNTFNMPEQPAFTFNLPEQPPAQVTVQPQFTVESPTVNVEPTQITVQPAEAKPPDVVVNVVPHKTRILRDAEGNMTGTEPVEE